MREGSGQEELRHFFMSELRTLTPSVTRASQHRKCFKEQEKEKKRKYQQRVLDEKMGSFYTFSVWN